MRLPGIVSFPLRRGADAVDLSAALLGQIAGVLRAVAGGSGGPVAAAAGAAAGGSTTATRTRGSAVRPSAAGAAAMSGPGTGSGSDEPNRPGASEPTEGRTAAERREPTPEPAQGASAAQAAGQRHPSSPKAARNVRARQTRAASLTTVESAPGHGRGGDPANVEAENVPTERAAAHEGRQPAPMGSEDAGDESSGEER